MVFRDRSLSRVSLCAFCLICFFSGTLSDVQADSLGADTPESATMPGATQDSISTDHSHPRLSPLKTPSFDLPGGRTPASGVAFSMSETGIPASEGSTNRTAKHGQNLLVITSRLTQEKSSAVSNIIITPELGYVNWHDNTFWTIQSTQKAGAYVTALAVGSIVAVCEPIGFIGMFLFTRRFVSYCCRYSGSVNSAAFRNTCRNNYGNARWAVSSDCAIQEKKSAVDVRKWF